MYEMSMADLAELASDLTTSLVAEIATALEEGSESGEHIDPVVFARDCERIVHGILRQHGFIIKRENAA
jgi:hypothetical protein